jgi:phosphatidate cytidylyltransferase
MGIPHLPRNRFDRSVLPVRFRIDRLFPSSEELLLRRFVGQHQKLAVRRSVAVRLAWLTRSLAHGCSNVLTGLAILGAKIFFQLMGMYHRSYFVLICYAGIVALGFCVWSDRLDLYNLLPMVVLGVSLIVPLMRNNYKRMIQYVSLTSLAFVLLGWSFMHLGLILKFPNGIYELMYLIILTEFCDNTNLALSRYIGRWHLFDRIDTKRTLGSTFVAAAATIALAFAMRHLLPDRSEVYWLTSGLVASFGGLFGDLVMTTIRRDAGIKIVGAFILGRGDFLHRVDRLIFVAPIYYYVMDYLHTVHNL